MFIGGDLGLGQIATHQLDQKLIDPIIVEQFLGFFVGVADVGEQGAAGLHH